MALPRLARRTALTLSAVGAALATMLATALVPPAQAEASGSVDFRSGMQKIDGFGFAQAFQRADVMHGARGLSPAKQQEVLDLLLSRDKGAGLSILRLGIGSSADRVYDHMHSIQPVDPGGPAAPPRYEWDGDDGGQVWLAQQAEKYGVKRFFADAWSAPGYMKDNGDDANGGTLCGLQGTSCAGGDWRQAYADYLVQYAKFYRQEGIKITDLGFTNEPDFTATYASMRFTPAQAAEFLKVLGPTVARSRMPIKLVCCDSFGWTEQAAYTAGIQADPQAARWVTTHTGHSYASRPTAPLPTTRRTWMSEWNPNGTTWNENWDDGSGYDGWTIATHIHSSLTTANANGYVYWFGASLGATRALIQLADGGDSYAVSKRLWAVAAYSRFIRPDATRVRVTADDPALQITAFRNADGSKVIEIINTATSATTARLALSGAGAGRPASYLTDRTHSLARTSAASVRGGRLSVDLPGRSLTTVVLGR
jgi:O-glycosyl hydrolase